MGCTEVALDCTGDLGGEAVWLETSDVGLAFFAIIAPAKKSGVATGTPATVWSNDGLSPAD